MAAEGDAGAGQGGQQQGAGGGQGQAGAGQGQGSTQGQHEQFVPYARFKEVVDKSNAFEQRLAAIEAASQAAQQAHDGQGQGRGQEDVENEALLKDPAGYVARKIMEARYADRKAQAIEALRGAEGYTQDLEGKVVQFIRENGLGAHSDPMKPIELAFKELTGKSLAEASGARSTRSVKERLARASGAGGGAGVESLQQVMKENPGNDQEKRKEWHKKFLAASEREAEG